MLYLLKHENAFFAVQATPGAYIKLIFGTRPWDFEARLALAKGCLDIALPPSTAPSPILLGKTPFKQKKKQQERSMSQKSFTLVFYFSRLQKDEEEEDDDFPNSTQVHASSCI